MECPASPNPWFTSPRHNTPEPQASLSRLGKVSTYKCFLGVPRRATSRRYIWHPMTTVADRFTRTSGGREGLAISELLSSPKRDFPYVAHSTSTCSRARCLETSNVTFHERIALQGIRTIDRTLIQYDILILSHLAPFLLPGNFLIFSYSFTFFHNPTIMLASSILVITVAVSSALCAPVEPR